MLRFYYIGDTDPESKLAIENGHLWSWAGFMAAHIWDINFAALDDDCSTFTAVPHSARFPLSRVMFSI